ncbi:LacI family DNA-binding transcriptional regulator [Jeotgalibacillus malaysiensis]|uniref:LacI family DNA-binding transcriptional regulator n=1 Tax=Jeotgalibacillus malaysiensis TaxID=1508404 RepID=UPI00384DC110
MTIKDIAKEANVSFSTVSKALNDSPLVKEPTKQRIVALAKEMGYEINTSAKILATGKSNAVGIYCPGITAPEYASYVHELSKQLKRRGFLPALSTSAFQDAKEMFSRLKTAYVIVVDKKEVHFPNVEFTYNPYIDTSDVAGINQYSLKKDAALKAASLLVHSGHRSVLIVSEYDDDWINQVLKRENEFDAVNHVYISTGDLERFFTVIKTTLDQTMPDAIICSSRKLAELTLLVSKSLGLNIPEDSSLIAYDDNVDPSSPVSMFGYSIEKVSEVTADFIFAKINEQEYDYVNLKSEMLLNYTVKL